MTPTADLAKRYKIRSFEEGKSLGGEFYGHYIQEAASHAELLRQTFAIPAFQAGVLGFDAYFPKGNSFFWET